MFMAFSSPNPTSEPVGLVDEGRRGRQTASLAFDRLSRIATPVKLKKPHLPTIKHNWMAGVKLGLVFAMTRPSIAGLLALASLGSSFGQSPETLQLNSVSLQTSIAVEIRLFSAAKHMAVLIAAKAKAEA